MRAAAGAGVRARGVWERGVRCERGDARSVARGPSAECGGEREGAGRLGRAEEKRVADLCGLGQRRWWAGVERGKQRTGLGPGRGLG